MKGFRKDNRGMTLVELLITITILGIVAVPLLHGFLTSAQTEVKARKMGQVTNVAQSVLEVVEANGFENVVVNIDDAYDVFKSSTNEDVDAEYYTLGGNYNSYGTNVPNAEDYHIGLTDYDYAGQKYDVMIDIEASGYQQLNAEDQMSINTQMDRVFDVISAPEAEKYFVYEWHFGNPWYDPQNYETIYVLPERKITVDVETENFGWEPHVRISVKYQLEDIDWEELGYEDAYITSNEPGRPGYPGYPGYPGDRDNDPVEVNYSYTYRLASGEEPTIYLLYYPNYAKTEGGYVQAKDTIEINNEDQIPFDLYIMKQKPNLNPNPGFWEPGLSEYDLRALENQYECDIVQNVRWLQPGQEEPGATIYTNLGKNLADNSDINRLQVNYTISHWWGSGVGTLNAFRTETETRQRIYEVTVKVYDASNDFSGEPLATLTGAILK